MSYQVLARKWRPSKFEDVVGQEHIVKSLQNSLLQNRLGHAYIFSGTRGIGKTSVARIFAKALRCENLLESGNACGECEPCKEFNVSSSMNVIEIDGASNNGVDDIRDLISNIQYLPTIGKYKVYIIDEVHMLSTPAFNALLKTLEEPPEHAIFIMATTEAHKLLGTVLSRCQKFDFRNASVSDLVSHIKRISEKEGITFESDNLITELATLGDGSFRDALSLLDQVLSFSNGKHIVEEIFAKSLGVAKTSAIKDLVHGIVNADINLVSNSYRKMLSENVSVDNITKSLLETVFALIMSKDFNDYNRVSQKIDKVYFDKISRIELYWIYEILAQDFKWATESQMPEDATELVIRKISLRNEFMANSNAEERKAPGKPEAIIFKPAENHMVEVEDVTEQEEIMRDITLSEIIEEQKEASKEEPVTFEDVKSHIAQEISEVEKVIAKDIERNWEGFLEYLGDTSPAAASNLEQGNLTKPISSTSETVVVSLGFPQTAKVFYDYLCEVEAFNKLKKNLAQFFDVVEDHVSLDLILVNKEEATKKHFESKFDIKIREDKEEEEVKSDEIENDAMIKHAESIFSARVDKINVNEKNRS